VTLPTTCAENPSDLAIARMAGSMPLLNNGRAREWGSLVGFFPTSEGTDAAKPRVRTGMSRIFRAAARGAFALF
jgi:hypothetical protein